MSLGLMIFMVLADIRFAEMGRREAESVTAGGEELASLLARALDLGRGVEWCAYTTLKGERKPSISEGADMSL